MFKNLGQLGNIAALMKEAQNIGPKMQEMADRLAKERVAGTSGGGMITVRATGDGQVLSVDIDPVLVEKADMEMVKDLLPAAINDALAKSAELKAEMMQSVTGDLPLPTNLPGNLGDMMKQFIGGGDPTDDDAPKPQ